MRKKPCKKGFEAVGLIIVFLVLALSPAICAMVTVEPMDKENSSDQYFSDDAMRYALIISVEKFDKTEFPESFIDRSTIDMYEKLVSSENWEEENIKLNIISGTFETIHYVKKFIHLGEDIDENA